MLEKLKSIWDAFNGNKTVIGLAILQLAPYLPEPYQGYCNLIGGLLTGVGVVHKAVKITGDISAK